MPESAPNQSSILEQNQDQRVDALLADIGTSAAPDDLDAQRVAADRALNAIQTDPALQQAFDARLGTLVEAQRAGNLDPAQQSQWDALGIVAGRMQQIWGSGTQEASRASQASGKAGGAGRDPQAASRGAGSSGGGGRRASRPAGPPTPEPPNEDTRKLWTDLIDRLSQGFDNLAQGSASFLGDRYTRPEPTATHAAGAGKAPSPEPNPTAQRAAATRNRTAGSGAATQQPRSAAKPASTGPKNQGAAAGAGPAAARNRARSGNGPNQSQSQPGARPRAASGNRNQAPDPDQAFTNLFTALGGVVRDNTPRNGKRNGHGTGQGAPERELNSAEAMVQDLINLLDVNPEVRLPIVTDPTHPENELEQSVAASAALIQRAHELWLQLQGRGHTNFPTARTPNYDYYRGPRGQHIAPDLVERLGQLSDYRRWIVGNNQRDAFRATLRKIQNPHAPLHPSTRRELQDAYRLAGNDLAGSDVRVTPISRVTQLGPGGRALPKDTSNPHQLLDTRIITFHQAQIGKRMELSRLMEGGRLSESINARWPQFVRQAEADFGRRYPTLAANANAADAATAASRDFVRHSIEEYAARVSAKTQKDEWSRIQYAYWSWWQHLYDAEVGLPDFGAGGSASDSAEQGQRGFRARAGAAVLGAAVLFGPSQVRAAEHPPVVVTSTSQQGAASPANHSTHASGLRHGDTLTMPVLVDTDTTPSPRWQALVRMQEINKKATAEYKARLAEERAKRRADRREQRRNAVRRRIAGIAMGVYFNLPPGAQERVANVVAGRNDRRASQAA